MCLRINAYCLFLRNFVDFQSLIRIGQNLFEQYIRRLAKPELIAALLASAGDGGTDDRDRQQAFDWCKEIPIDNRSPEMNQVYPFFLAD